MMVIEQETLIHAVFAERLELGSFPFDCQDLSIDVHWKVSDEECKIWPTPGAHHFVEIQVEKMAISEWEIHPPVVEFSNKAVRAIGKDLKSTHENQPVLLIRLKLQRREVVSLRRLG